MGEEVTVIDVGAAHYRDFKSVEHICDEFKPRFALGLDPRSFNDCYWYGETFVVMLDVAAWTRRGTISFVEAALGSYVNEADEGRSVHCVDLADLVRAFAPVVLKIDAEGAEYPLVEHLLAEGVDDLIRLAWIEWHDTGHHLPGDRKDLIRRLRCDYAEWRL